MSQETFKTKEELIRDFIRSLDAIEDSMEPYKEQRRDLKKNFVENGWFSKEEMRMLIRARRLMKDEVDFDKLEDMYKKVRNA